MSELNPADVPVVILCGGLGMRLREETHVRPKPMVEIGPAPILWHIMKGYSHYGFRRFVLCAGYRGHVIKQFFREFEVWGEDMTVRLGESGATYTRNTFNREPWEVTVAETGADTMTGGRIARIRHYVDSDVFMATYGDGLSDIDFGAELAFHRKHGRIATLAAMRPHSRFGMVEFDDAGLVQRFREKPLLDNWVNGGFYVFSRQIFDHLDDHCVLEHGPVERLTEDGQLAAYRHDGYWETMDTYRDYLFLNEVWDRGEAGWKVWES